MEWDEVVDKAEEYFSDHYGDLEDVANELSRYTDYVHEHVIYESGYYPMDELDDYFSGMNATDILDRIDSDFSTGDDYFYEGGYTLESTDDPDYDYSLLFDDADSFITEVYDNNYRLNLPDYIEKLFEAYDEEDEDEEEDEEDTEE